MDDLYFMDEALALAREAAAEGEVPVGCVIVRGDEIVGRGRNRRETKKSALGHAEIEAIDAAHVLAGENGCDYCDGCFTGQYPIDIPAGQGKNKFEQPIHGKDEK